MYPLYKYSFNLFQIPFGAGCRVRFHTTRFQSTRLARNIGRATVNKVYFSRIDKLGLVEDLVPS